MKISETMSIEDLVAIVFDEDDEYSWSSKSEARDAIIRKFNAAKPLRAVDAAKVCPECDGAVEFCAMGHYVPSAPRT